MKSRMQRLSLPVLVLLFVSFETAAYTPDTHELSVREAAQLCEVGTETPISAADVAAMSRGVREPDDWSPALLQLVTQRFEPGTRGKRRGINARRIAEQSFHGSPNPTRAPYSDSVEDRELRSRAVALPESKLLPDRLDLDVYSYDTNRAMRNKLLLNASQLMCVSLAHDDDAWSARKLGNLLHMVGDTYSASHVQRSEPSDAGCGTEKIEWFFSMDLVSWKQHAAADEETEDWRFDCLVTHAAELMRLWATGRSRVQRASGDAARLESANAGVEQVVEYLCSRVFRGEPDVLERPTGGAAAGYSIASGTDNWVRVFAFWREQPDDQPIQPVGLTGRAEAERFVARVNARLTKQGFPAYFTYPSHEDGDFCEAFASRGSLPGALQCTAQELEWAASASPLVEAVLLPPRGGTQGAP